MRVWFLFTIVGCVLLGFLATAAVQPSEKLVFKTAMGDVTFLHATHAQRLKGECAACHDKLFPQSTTEPLNWKPGMHKPAESAKTSCGGCHRPDGTAFGTTGNCAKCHVK